jgi:hypothetical protein
LSLNITLMVPSSVLATFPKSPICRATEFREL